MKFLYALMLTLVSSFMFFWIYIFLIPTPHIILSTNVTTELQSNPNDLATYKALEISKFNSKEKYYVFDADTNLKKIPSFVKTMALTIIFIFSFLLMQRKKVWITIPILLSVIIAFIIHTTLWIFTNSIDKNIYLDLQGIRDIYYVNGSIPLFILFLFIQTIVIGVGYLVTNPQDQTS